MSMDREGDSAGPKINLKTFRSHFSDLVDLVEERKSHLPTIVVIGERNDATVRNFIQNLFGFAIDLNHIKNPVKYRFINDDTCEDNEVFCTVGDSHVEIDLPIEYDFLVDRINRSSNWAIKG